MGCKDSVKNNDNVEILNFNGMKGKSEYMCFINPKEGYSFNYTTESEEQTEEQLGDPNFFPESTDISTIYKTIDGGKNWVNVYSINDFHFYSTAFYNKNAVYIKIISSKDVLKNKLLKFELKTNKVTILNFNFERMGEIWTINQDVYVNSKNNGINNLYSIDNNFTKIDSIKEDNVFRDRITLLGNTPYVITWDNEIYNVEKKEAVRLINNDLESIAGIGKSNLLIACKNKSSIELVGYNIDTKEKKHLKEFEGYSIVQGLQSNDKVICGFIGNIKGMFTEYDLFYSLDKGKTWQIQELKEKSYIRPSTLIDDILYVFSGGKRIQKILLK
ncbi:hypothetical protein BWK59_13370 [Flavobacterium davisii]|uniref:Exo-alpha-sialidase n=2 Tax=Flavobacterium davisii TaxID=2906077 RepID=A0A246GFI8_9FLAO|nr:hypothetical protein BWK59_13370 [Flavobacterium davisii]